MHCQTAVYLFIPLQYPNKVSGHPREAYNAKTAFSLGRHGYNFKATLMKFVLRVLFSKKPFSPFEKGKNGGRVRKSPVFKGKTAILSIFILRVGTNA